MTDSTAQLWPNTVKHFCEMASKAIRAERERQVDAAKAYLAKCDQMDWGPGDTGAFVKIGAAQSVWRASFYCDDDLRTIESLVALCDDSATEFVTVSAHDWGVVKRWSEHKAGAGC